MYIVYYIGIYKHIYFYTVDLCSALSNNGNFYLFYRSKNTNDTNFVVCAEKTGFSSTTLHYLPTYLTTVQLYYVKLKNVNNLCDRYIHARK